MERAPDADVILVGGGGIGLACARALAASGRSVLLLERGRTGREATLAAGGMLSPLAEADGPGPFLSLELDSLRRWPAFAEELRAESTLDVELRLEGKLLLALDDEAAARLRARHCWLAAAGFRAEWLEGTQLGEREPAAGPAVGGLLLPEEGQVDNRMLARALRVAAERAGCRIREGVAVTGVLGERGRARGVRLEDGTELSADQVVLAAGAWSGSVAGLPRPLPVRPVKGQMIALRAEAPAPLLRGIVESDACYVIPRRGEREARVWVGATSEEAGFVRGTTAEASGRLHAAAARAVPALTRARVVEAWDGFRPGTPDGLPVLGEDPALAGLIHATGHYRNGILLTPVTAELVAKAALGAPEPRATAFRPDRFEAL